MNWKVFPKIALQGIKTDEGLQVHSVLVLFMLTKEGHIAKALLDRIMGISIMSLDLSLGLWTSQILTTAEHK